MTEIPDKVQTALYPHNKKQYTIYPGMKSRALRISVCRYIKRNIRKKNVKRR